MKQQVACFDSLSHQQKMPPASNDVKKHAEFNECGKVKCTGTGTLDRQDNLSEHQHTHNRPARTHELNTALVGFGCDRAVQIITR